ncbi:MAG: PA14 domain-containing protein [Limisphaerales bacterium]
MAAHAGSLRTRDGKFLEGTVQLDAPAGVKITLASGEQQKVPLANLDQATFTSGAANSLPPEVAALMKGRGNGLLGTYYDRVDLSGRTVHRLDETLNFDWETGEPVAGVQKDYFSARWAGQLEAPVSGKFTFHLDADDGARLWIADRLVCDAWRLADTAEVTGEMELNAGRRYDLRVEYYDKLGPAHVRLSWAGPGIPRSIVPRSQLYAAIGTQAAEVASAHGLLAAYFRRTELDSSSAVTRIDPQLDFNWGDNAPVPDVPAQSFSARWIGRVAAQFTESYTFHVEAGGGVRLWLDGQIILDQWRDRPGEFYSTVVPLTAGQKYDLRLEHFSTSKEARMRLLWSSASQRKSPVPADALTPSHSGEPVASGARHGLLGAYFSRPDCSGEVLKRLDAQVNFDWADKPAAPGVPTEDFSVRWTGQVQAQHSENYTFHVEADDGVRVWLGDRQIMDEWRQQSTTLVSQPVTLNAGQYYPLTIEFYSAKPPAMAKLKWSSPSTPLGIIPASRLFPPNATGAPVSGERRLGLDRGVVTWDGSFLAAPLVSADDTALQFGGAQKDFSLSTVNVARITFQNLSAQRAAKIEPGRAGVLLVNGDFVDGEFKGLERGRVKLSSVLFGLKYFDATYEVVAVVLRGLTPGSPKFRVRTSDGSVLLVKKFSVAADGLTVEDATLRGYRVPAQELVELTQGSGTNLFSASLNLGPNSPHAEVAKAGAAAEREWKDKAEAVRSLVAAENARRSRVEADEERKARTELDAATEAERLLKGALTRLTEHQDQLNRVRNELKDAETKADAARAEAKKAAEVAEAKSGEADRMKAAHEQRKAEGVQRSKELNLAIQSRDQTLRKLNAEAIQLESVRSLARRKLETARPVAPGKSEDEAKAARAKAEELLKQAEARCADAKAAREKQTAELAAKVKELETARKNLDRETSGLAAGCNQLTQERAQLRLAKTRADGAVDRAAVDVASKRRSLAVAETLVAQATDKKNAAEKTLAEARATVARRARAQFK